MKQLPNDVVVGGAYHDAKQQMTRYVTAVRPKGRGFYVEWSAGEGCITYRDRLETFRRACNVNRRESA